MQTNRHNLNGATLLSDRVVGTADAGPLTLRDGTVFQCHSLALADGTTVRAVLDEFGRILRIIRPSEVVGT